MGNKDPLQTLMRSGGGTLRKLLGIAVAVALLMIVVKFPQDAASWVNGLWGWATDIIDGIASFIRQAA